MLRSMPSLCSSTIVYMFEHNILLPGYGHLRLQGDPHGQLPPQGIGGIFSDSEVGDLAGGAFNSACAGTVLYSLYLNPYGSWWNE